MKEETPTEQTIWSVGKPVVSPTRLVCGLACGLSGRAKLTEDSATLRVRVLGAIKSQAEGAHYRRTCRES